MDCNCTPHGDALLMQEKLDKVIAEYKDEKGALIPILHKAQDIYGYLPPKVQLRIANALNIPLSEVHGVVTFYTGFRTKPAGEYRISVCLGTACYVKGAQEIMDALKSQLGIEEGECTDDMKFSLDACRCIGACGLAPVITINGKVYGKISEKDVAGILAEYEDI